MAGEIAQLQTRLRAGEGEREAAQGLLARQAEDVERLQAQSSKAVDQLQAASEQHQQACAGRETAWQRERAARQADLAALQQRCTAAEEALQDSQAARSSLEDSLLACQARAPTPPLAAGSPCLLQVGKPLPVPHPGCVRL